MIAHMSLLPLSALLGVSKRLASTKHIASAFYLFQLRPKKKKIKKSGNHMAAKDSLLYFHPSIYVPCIL